MSVSRGKQFERIVKQELQRIPGVLCDRLYDNTSGFVNINTPSDFIVFRTPNFYFVECKTIHGQSIPNANFVQLPRILSRLQNVDNAFGYFIIWFVDYKETYVVSATFLDRYINKQENILNESNFKPKKSINHLELNKFSSMFEKDVIFPKQEYKRVFPKIDFSNIF